MAHALAGSGSPFGRRRVTLQDVARAARVSKAAASRALGGYGDIGPATRERIQEAARDLGYRPSVRARALSGRGATVRCAVVSLGMATAALGRPFYGAVLTGITSQAPEEHLDLHLVALPGEAAHRAELLAQLLADDGADAVLLLTFFPLTPADTRPLEEGGVPYVLVNRHFGAVPGSCVTVDWAGDTRHAVEHLAALGHQRMALLLPEGTTSTIQDHGQGWRAGLAACSLSGRAAPILRFSSTAAGGGRELGARLLAEGLPDSGAIPTAVVCENDACGHGVLAAAQALGVRVPDQLSVLGFDNLYAAYTAPPLCSFEPHLHDLGV